MQIKSLNIVVFTLFIFGLIVSGGQIMSCHANETALSYADVSYPYTVKYLTINGQKMAYIDEGAGATVIFLHGVSTDLNNFHMLYPEFIKKGYRVLGLDMIGYGKSDKPAIPYSVDFHAGTIIEFSKKLSLKKVTLIGHNSGATIALTVALKEPSLVHSLMLLSPLGLTSIPVVWLEQYKRNYDNAMGITYTDPARFTPYFHSLVYKWNPYAEDFLQQRLRLIRHPDWQLTMKAVRETTFSALTEADNILANINSIKQPVLVLLGQNDNNVNPQNIKNSLGGKAAAWRILLLPESGMLVHFEQPEKVLVESFAFLKSDSVKQALRNEFSDVKPLAGWQILDKQKIAKAEILKDGKGNLVLTPAPVSGNYWYNDATGAYLYQNIKGDFTVEIKLSAINPNNRDKAPGGNFNSAGIAIRNPGNGGGENWIMYNVGRQHGAIGRETKTTANSVSVLQTPAIDKEQLKDARLLICRIKDKFYLYHWLKNETKWMAEDSPEYFSRPDLPELLQVGIVTNIYGKPYEVQAEVDYVRFSKPQKKKTVFQQ